MLKKFSFLLLCVLAVSCGKAPDSAPPSVPGTGIEAAGSSTQLHFDLLIRNGQVFDGSGGAPYSANVGLNGDRITYIGNEPATADSVIDAHGLAVAPGFINMLSWATESLVQDGRSMSDIRQGVTLEVMGEGWSMGPLNESMKIEMKEQQVDIRFDIEWTTLGENLTFLEDRGISTNVASFVGATTVRIHELGYENRAPSDAELERMRGLVKTAMEEGAMGLGSSLIYAPAFFADTNELIELSRVAATHGGRYISHMRNEGNQLNEAVDELITIAREAGIGAEIYHLKAAGEDNWNKLDSVFEQVEAARAEGLDITADMYTYIAGATGLYAAMPLWVQEGGHDAWVERLKDPAVRARLEQEMTTPSDDWENLYLAAGGAENIILIGFKNPALKPLTGKTLAEVAEMRGTSPAITMMDLVIEDDSRVSAAYFLMKEDNIRKKIAQPWMAFGSDEESKSLDEVFTRSNAHPRAFGNFARLLGKYVREDKVISLPEAIHRLTRLPARNLKIADRGELKEGFFADITIFDPATIQDHATFAEPHQYATGVQHVIVNGVPVLANAEHTGAMPGRFIKGPGYREVSN